ncbi:hypothetical protein LO762_17995 [Actinocorallia sp. API 0066]|uniref:hypothetical protein n=1 Tax=Actinocorallia sp. API 0066 TaxID=2896846 RepID=UPI001E5129F2|nr:hypothetical protein [Actinocorallia sp. API 0066]MCD0451076.1 hypothetical protein [Actinocorallia sp. API 0066]
MTEEPVPASSGAAPVDRAELRNAVTDQPVSVAEETSETTAADEVAAALANWPTNTANPRRTQI